MGVYLKTACFTHGQLYVAASRVGNAEHLKCALDRDADGSYRTPNKRRLARGLDAMRVTVCVMLCRVRVTSRCV